MVFRKNSIFSSFFALALVVLLLSACNTSTESDVTEGDGSSSSDSEETFVFKLGHIAPDEHSYTKGIEAFAEAVGEATDGRVEFEIYGNGQLGGERDVVEQVQLGSLDMTIVTAGPVGNFVDKFSVLEMPFLFRDIDHVYNTLDGEVGVELTELLDGAGFKTLGIWENGFRHLTNNKLPIVTPEDMNGLKMRTVENDIYVSTYQSLGTDPTPIAFPELYTSFSQGLVDGTDLSYGVKHSTKMYEVQNHLSEVGIYYAAAPVLMNIDLFESLPADIQQILVEKGEECKTIQRQMNQDMEEKQKADLKELGVDIVESSEIDIDKFQVAVEKVYEQQGARFGDLIERIRAVE
ncbi:TRAP transporter substrate-binding protein DctP [Bacillus sp. FJAT-45350]|uniref:TRAP transporter substrate-binding protein DctP n=1 Tax=Bacillus sp. FJAT-45350 TaxID=2011014 RepID=UPI000BB8DD0B|nr:TRAP transporter substrate-binding protein DctP [Bacillus sp. FJAT-45350]